MEPRARDAYLEVQVKTASPQKLRLMLIEGAIRWAQQALNCSDADKAEETCEAIIRCRQIVTELMAAVKADDSELARAVIGVHLFLFRTLTEAQLHRDRRKIEEVLEVLESERETWRRVCEKLPEAPPLVPADQDKSREITTSGARAIPPAAPHETAAANLAAKAAEQSGFSLEA